MTDKLVELIAKYFEKLNPNTNHIIATQLAGYLRNNGVTFAVDNNMWIFHVVGFEGDSDSYWASSPIDVTVLAESEKEAIKKTEAVTGRKLSGRNRNIIVIERAVFELKENA